MLALLICKGLTRLFLSPRWAASGSGDYGGETAAQAHVVRKTELFCTFLTLWRMKMAKARAHDKDSQAYLVDLVDNFEYA